MSNKPGSQAKTGYQHPIGKKPLDPKRVLQILECKRRVLQFVESMLEDEITLDELRAGEELICQMDYDSIVQERHILKLCGYPLCSNKIVKEWKQRYHLSLKDKRIYDVEIRKLYCCVKCMDTSIKYRDENVPPQPVWMRLDGLTMGPDGAIIGPDGNEIHDTSK